jgi:hypothetical protein
MTKSITPKSSSNDEALLQTNTVPVDWPPPDTKRWVPRRKAVIVNAVHSGAMSLEEVCRCYELSVEEFLTWPRAIETHGVAGAGHSTADLSRCSSSSGRRCGGSERRTNELRVDARIGDSHARAYCHC